MEQSRYVNFSDAPALRTLLENLGEDTVHDIRLIASDRNILLSKRADGIVLSVYDLQDIVRVDGGECYHDSDLRHLDITTDNGYSCTVVYEGDRIVNCYVD